MYGLITRLTVVPGKREEMISILRAGVANMPGCLSYVIALDAADQNGLWITEVWKSAAEHGVAVASAPVREAMSKGRPLIAGFSRVATTEPVSVGA